MLNDIALSVAFNMFTTVLHQDARGATNMLGMTPEAVLGLLGGGAGIASGLLANAVKAKADIAKMQMQNMIAQTEAGIKMLEATNKEFETKTSNSFVNMTRRVLVLGFLTMIFVIAMTPAFVGEIGIAVPVVKQTGGSYLFGLIDTSREWTEWEVVKQAVMIPDWAREVAIMIFSFYTTSSSVKR
jgi:hypothetical protein